MIDRFWEWLWAKRYNNPSMNVTGASNPNLNPWHRFQALSTFEHPVTGMVFVEGYIYNVVQGDKKLQRLMKRWYKKGLVAVEQEEE